VYTSNDNIGHGTAVASEIAANVNDGFGMVGFGGDGHVIAVNASDDIWFFDAKIAVALDKLVSLGARIVNMSLGGTTPSEPILVDAIHRAAANGVLLVASAGNDAHNRVTWPAADLQPAGGGRSYGIAVGATDVDGRRATFSDWGGHLSMVAPGTYGGTYGGVVVALPTATWFDDKDSVIWTDDRADREAFPTPHGFDSCRPPRKQGPGPEA
jgi:serine protease